MTDTPTAAELRSLEDQLLAVPSDSPPPAWQARYPGVDAPSAACLAHFRALQAQPHVSEGQLLDGLLAIFDIWHGDVPAAVAERVRRGDYAHAPRAAALLSALVAGDVRPGDSELRIAATVTEYLYRQAERGLELRDAPDVATIVSRGAQTTTTGLDAEVEYYQGVAPGLLEELLRHADVGADS